MRFPRPVMALVASGVAAASIGLTAVPAHADQIRHQEWWLSSLGITHAWAASQGAGVTIAVLSDGVDASQADLTGAVTAAPAPAGAPVATGQFFGEQGTAIASLIAGRGHSSADSAGILGVAPDARILSIPVTLPADDPDLTITADAEAIPGAIAAGIRYAVRRGATVIDLPIDPGEPGSTGTGGAMAAAGGSTAEQSAVDYALKHNVVLVAPAGDDGAGSDAIEFPASYPGVIAVGAFDSAFDKALWTSHQSYVTLTAAGEGVVAADNAGGSQTMNSTAAASAIVAGIAALLQSRYPGLTESQVRKALITSTVFRPAHGLSDGSGYGSVNADHAMAAAGKIAAPAVPAADAGAQVPTAPAPVAAPAAVQSISSKLTRAGLISGGLLVLLLLLVAGVAALGRRRRRKRAGTEVATAEWAHRQGQSRYPQAASGGTDRMLEVFTAPVAEPAARDLARSGLPELAGRAGFSPAGAADSGRMPAQGPASRAVSRRPVVSGAPPWEPAAAPEGELPWAAEAGEHAGEHAAQPAALQQPAARAQPAGQTRGAPRSHRDPDSPWAPGGEGPAAVRPVASPDPMSPRYQRERWQEDEPYRAELLPAADFASEATAAHWERAREQAQAAHWGSAEDLSRVAQRAGWAPQAAGQAQAAADPSEFASDPAASSSAAGQRRAPSGLPVRQPKASQAAPMSPSGSLWDAAGAPGSSLWDKAENGAGSPEGSTPGRPIFVWNPADDTSRRPRD